MGAAVTRMAATARLMGEAAGRAAVLALNGKCAPSEVDAQEIRARLPENGAILDE